MQPDRLRAAIRARQETLIRGRAAQLAPPTPTGPGDRCPRCGSHAVALIVFGVLDWTPDLENALRAGAVVPGGCLVFGDDPDRECNECRHRWRTTGSL